MPKLTRVAGFEWGTGLLHQPDVAGGGGAGAARRRESCSRARLADALVDRADRGRVVRSLAASGNNSVVECDLAKVEVAGSNPVSRSNLRSRSVEGCPAVAATPRRRALPSLTFRHVRPAPSPSGKAEVCKTSIPGSNPGGASNPVRSNPDTPVSGGTPGKSQRLPGSVPADCPTMPETMHAASSRAPRRRPQIAVAEDVLNLNSPSARDRAGRRLHERR